MTSGGIESTVAAADAHVKGDSVYLIHYDLGRKQDPMELHAVNSFSITNNIPLKIVHLNAFQEIYSGIIPSPFVVQEADIVPNSVSFIPSLTQLSLSFAKQVKAANLIIGLTSEQLTADRIKFFRSIENANNLFNAEIHKTKIVLPFAKQSKVDVIKLGAKLNVDFANTWSCEIQLLEHCGTCKSCIERKKSFKKAKVTDPTIYSK